MNESLEWVGVGKVAVGKDARSVIPAKAGIHLLCLWALRENRLTSVCGFARHPGGRVTFFACPKKVTQERAPSRSRSRGHPCPRDRASRLRGLPAVRPCTVGKLAGILPAIAARLFLHLLAATWRGPGEAKDKRGSCRRRKSVFALLLTLTLCEAAKVGRKRPRAPHAVRARTARIWRQGRSPAAKPRPTAANRRQSRRRVTEGAFLWLLSLCKQRK